MSTTVTDRWLLAVTGVVLLALFLWAATLVPDVVPTITAVQATPGLLICGIGVFLLLRTDARRIGWLLILQTFFIVHVSSTFVYEATGSTVAGVVGPLGWNALTFLGVAIILYPTGRPASRVLAAFVVLAVGANLLASIHWVGVNVAWWEAVVDPMALAIQASSVPLFLSFFEQARIYRRRSPLERTQMKWYLLGLVAQPLYAIPGLFGWSEAAFIVASGILSMSFPIAILIGITRYRLYEIDRLISRTLAYALVLGLLGALFVGGVALIAALLPTQDSLAVVLTTLAVVGLFDPLRRRVTSAVDRRFDRSRYEAGQVVEQFGRTIAEVADLTEVRLRLHDVLGRTVAPATVAVWEPAGGDRSTAAR